MTFVDCVNDHNHRRGIKKGFEMSLNGHLNGRECGHGGGRCREDHENEADRLATISGWREYNTENEGDPHFEKHLRKREGCPDLQKTASKSPIESTSPKRANKEAVKLSLQRSGEDSRVGTKDFNDLFPSDGVGYRILVCNGGDDSVEGSTLWIVTWIFRKKEGPCQAVFLVILLRYGSCECSLSRTKGSIEQAYRAVIA